MPAPYIVERLAIEPFGSLEGVLRGDPIRIFPVGKFYRDERVLDVTPQRLQEFARNIKAGLPRFEVPINLEHEKQWGRYGSVQDLEYMETGPDGPGLYATAYQLTPDGRRLLTDQRFKGLSGEAVWTLYDGAKYQDPNTGKEHDNTLVGLALTNTPFFGKEVNMYSADADWFRTFDAKQRLALAKSGAAMPDGSYPISNAGDLQNAIHAIGRGKGSHAAIKAHIIKRAKALGAEKMLPADWMSDEAEQEGDSMSDTDTTETMARHNGFTKLNAKVKKVSAHIKAAYDAILDDGGLDSGAGEADEAAVDVPGDDNSAETEDEKMDDAAEQEDADDESSEEGLSRGKKNMSKKDTASAGTQAQGDRHIMADQEKFSVSAEEFAALKAKAAKVDELETLAKTQAAETLAIKRARRHDQIVAHVDTFSAAVATPELADKFQALEEADPKLFEFFDGLLAKIDAQLAQSQLFAQVGTTRSRGAAETFEDAIETELKDKFGGDRAKYSEAFSAVSVKRPDLAQEYLNRGR